MYQYVNINYIIYVLCVGVCAYAYAIAYAFVCAQRNEGGGARGEGQGARGEG